MPIYNLHLEIEAAESKPKADERECCRPLSLYCLSACAGVTEEEYCEMYPENFPSDCEKLAEGKDETGTFYNIYLIVSCTKLLKLDMG